MQWALSADCNKLCMHLRVFVFVSICVYVSTCAHLPVCVCMRMFVFLHVLWARVHLQARASVREALPAVSAAPPCHLERKSSVKYSIVWDQAPWQRLSS